MPKSLRSSLVPGVAVAATLILTAGALAAPAGAAESPKKPKFDIDNVGYSEVMRAGAVETFADIPRTLPQNVGYSQVELIKDIQEESPRCIADGAGYWLGDIVEEGVFKGGAAPIEEGQTQTDASPYDNPTINRVYRPTGAAAGDTATADRTPKFPANGNGPLWTSECSADFFGGSGTGDMINAAGTRIAGSSVSAAVDTATGIYTSTGRAYVTGIKGAFDTITSLMQVTHVPNEEPKVTYRMSFFDSDAGKSSFASDGAEFFGSAVPASQFVDQFNTQSAAFSQQGAAFGPAGLQILSPQVYPDQDNGRMTITAPAAAGNLGFASRNGTLGENFGARFASITWTGDNVSADAL
ncbi:hypothetical protein [Sporichthya sp.]|uniref:hypothetical protein n=1 Tax=Sporichthya sp. TaxID=65475 RepID=UPI0017FB045D|nr:hypothetical protein [Sporichthya sp.]MBA3742236.1 hypothetical protein [Sporichthya sp.]